MNPFANWTQAQVDSFNQRVRMKTAKQHNAELVGESVLTPAHIKTLKVIQQLKARLPEPGKRLRQSGTRMNKLEMEFHAYLKALYPAAFIYAQSITFVIANGVRYSPDFVVFSPLSGIVDAYETKGFMRDDAAVKIKVAASKFTNIKWTLAWKQHGQWKQQPVFP